MIPANVTHVANHLWQSTLFAAALGLLSLAFRRHRAKVRYALWLAASVKFLIPFAILVSLGGPVLRTRRTARLSIVAAGDFLCHGTRSAQPFVHARRLGAEGCAAAESRPWPASHRGVGVRIRGNSLLVGWSQMEGSAGGRASGFAFGFNGDGGGDPVVFLADAGSQESSGFSGRCCCCRKGWPEHLSQAEWEAVLAHELCHVRRRDNVAAALHMAVEAVFWFHPLVWWMGSRLVAERERACDEEVLRLGSEAQVYAEGILKVCERYLTSPLECVAGVTGSNLRRSDSGDYDGSFGESRGCRWGRNCCWRWWEWRPSRGRL